MESKAGRRTARRVAHHILVILVILTILIQTGNQEGDGFS